MAMTGGGWTVGAQHNHNLEAWFVHSPGLKVVMPSTAADFKGLLKSAIRDDNPVLFFSDMTLGYVPGEVPEGEELVPIGKAAVRREGSDVTLISYSKAVNACLDAATSLAQSGVSAEVIDLRTLKPLDEDTILRSARKTGRVIVVHEASRMCGVGAEVSSIIVEQAFGTLKAPIMRITGPDAPAASSYVLEQAFMPHADTITAAALKLLGKQAENAQLLETA
jgi:pyruvate dehydrogenase E1 component beta subunit